MTFSTKTKLLLGGVSASGGCCAVAVPVMMSSDNVNSRSTETHLVSQKSSEMPTNVQEDLALISEDLVSDNLDEVWTTINEDFKKKQTNNRDVELPWGSELKNILRKERETINNWEATKQEWVNCNIDQQAVGSKVDYCGYIELKNDSDEYKMRVSYSYIKSSSQNSWEVILVKKNGNSAKYYDGTKKTWEGPRMTWDTNFQGSSGGNNNGWSNLGTASIKISS